MDMHSSRLEGYSLLLVLRFCHYSYRSHCLPLALHLTLRVHIDDGFNLIQYHSPDYIEINQL